MIESLNCKTWLHCPFRVCFWLGTLVVFDHILGKERAEIAIHHLALG